MNSYEKIVISDISDQQQISEKWRKTKKIPKNLQQLKKKLISPFLVKMHFHIFTSTKNFGKAFSSNAAIIIIIAQQLNAEIVSRSFKVAIQEVRLSARSQ